MNKKRTKRVVGSAEVTYDEQGNLIATNFKAYKKGGEPANQALSITRRQDYTIYEYLEHYNLVFKIPKDIYINSRNMMAALVDALLHIERGTLD